MILRALILLAFFGLTACVSPSGDVSRAPIDPVAELTAALLAMGADVDPAEASRAAKLAYDYTAQLRHEYQITDPPLIHNAKVNAGLKPRGLCWHWAEDMQRRLQAEGFQTLAIHRAIANHDNLRIDHSTAILSAKGDTMFDGMVLDPWRKGGVLTWVPVLSDTRYDWRPQAEVHQYYIARGRL